jgi:hypothetical protein
VKETAHARDTSSMAASYIRMAVMAEAYRSLRRIDIMARRLLGSRPPDRGLKARPCPGASNPASSESESSLAGPTRKCPGGDAHIAWCCWCCAGSRAILELEQPAISGGIGRPLCPAGRDGAESISDAEGGLCRGWVRCDGGEGRRWPCLHTQWGGRRIVNFSQTHRPQLTQKCRAKRKESAQSTVVP